MFYIFGFKFFNFPNVLKMRKIVTILGARPQFIKAAVLSRVILEKAQFKEVIVHTGQHFDDNMNTVFFNEMDIPLPKYQLNINGLNHGAMTGQMLEKIEEVLLKEHPDAVVVYGDTNSTLAGALAAKKLGIKLVHVEAGLRSFNESMPEETNRILTDRISDLLCCPTDTAINNLANEGFDLFPAKIEKCGDIMKDAAEYYGMSSAERSTVIKDHSLKENSFILATVHRQENTKNPAVLRSVFEALGELNKTTSVVLPLHPGTKKKMEAAGIQTSVKCIPPVGYFDMLELLKHCQLVATDSGGLQKEAFFHAKRCLILREETEWVELVQNNFATIGGNQKDSILNAHAELMKLSPDFSKDLYGNKVGTTIHDAILGLIAEAE